MKKLFMYYSLTGNGDIVANYYKEKGYDIKKIEVKKSLPKNFALSMFVGGFKALVSYKEKLINFDDNTKEYDEIIIGTPIWFDRLCSPIKTLLGKIQNKNINFVIYSGSGEGHKAEEYIKNNYKNANIIFLKEPKKYKGELKKLK